MFCKKVDLLFNENKGQSYPRNEQHGVSEDVHFLVALKHPVPSFPYISELMCVMFWDQ